MSTENPLIKEQFKLEHLSVEEARRKYRKKMAEGNDMPPDRLLLKKAMPHFQTAVDSFVNTKVRSSAMHIRPELQKLSVWNISYMVLANLIFSKNVWDYPLQKVSYEVGSKIQDELNYQLTVTNNPGYMKVVEDNLKTRHQTHRKKVVKHVQKKLEVETVHWSWRFKHDVGHKLLSLLVQSTGMFKLVGIKRTGQEHPEKFLKPTKETEQWMDEAHRRAEVMHPDCLPMVIPPKEWGLDSFGGYYTRELPVVTGSSVDNLSRGVEQSELSKEMYDMLNILQNTPWKINKQVLEIASELANRDYKLGVLDSTTDVVFPLKPVADEHMEEFKKNNPDEFKQWLNKMARAYGEQASIKSKILNQSASLSTAERFQEYEAIYFPWRVDFRGRAYPIATQLNPQGSDLSKGLLQFAEGKELGESGVYWLAVHGANCYGEDKIKLDDRVKWVKDHQELILDSARDPLGGERFWIDADKPWEFLAFCFEWAGYVSEGPSFKSHLKVAVDGSCNGLQHLSAMLRDEVGGTAVNLRDLEERQDIYNIVAEKVSEAVRKDAAEGNEMAKLWDGLVTRKIVKRNVMTVPYGATKKGMGDQIKDEVKRQRKPEHAAIREYKWDPYAYLADKVSAAIGTTVYAAVDVMDWMKECAQVFNTADQGIVWITSAGMVVAQHKLKISAKRIKTMFGEQVLKLSIPEYSGKLNTSKQANSISPNIIHSFDAAHQALTVLKCYRNHNVDHFGMVHDSFGTHAADMGVLYQVLRDEFVGMYSKDILNDLREQFKVQLPEEYKDALPEVPEFGNLNLEEVRSSAFFFA